MSLSKEELASDANREILEFALWNRDLIKQHIERTEEKENEGCNTWPKTKIYSDEEELNFVKEVMRQFYIDAGSSLKSTTPPPMPLEEPITKFHLFGDFVSEIRRQIWVEALSVDYNGIVEVFDCDCLNEWDTLHEYSESSAPNIRLACKEADDIFRSLYYIGLSARKETPYSPPPNIQSWNYWYSSPVVAFNFSRDIVYLNTVPNQMKNLPRSFDVQDFQRIRFLAINASDFAASDFTEFVTSHLHLFIELKKLILVCNDKNKSGWRYDPVEFTPAPGHPIALEFFTKHLEGDETLKHIKLSTVNVARRYILPTTENRPGFFYRFTNCGMVSRPLQPRESLPPHLLSGRQLAR